MNRIFLKILKSIILASALLILIVHRYQISLSLFLLTRDRFVTHRSWFDTYITEKSIVHIDGKDAIDMLSEWLSECST